MAQLTVDQMEKALLTGVATSENGAVSVTWSGLTGSRSVFFDLESENGRNVQDGAAQMRRARITGSTDTTSGVPAPAIDDTVTIDGDTWTVTEVLDLRAGAFCVIVETMLQTRLSGRGAVKNG